MLHAPCSLTQHWAAVLDDFVAPVVSGALAPGQSHSHDTATSVRVYQQLFLGPDGQDLTPWCRSLPVTHPFLYELMSRFLRNAVQNLQLCLKRLTQDLPLLTPLLVRQHTSVRNIITGRNIRIIIC